MAKRFTDTTKWTGNKWFRKLPNDIKLLWLYMLDTCDAVGVWEEDIELAEIILGISVDKAEVIMYLDGRIHIFKNGDKWWIRDFCDFQYGQLSEDSKSNPIQSHISLLKKHTLWEGYMKGTLTLKEKDKDKDKEKAKDKDARKDNNRVYADSVENIYSKYPSKCPIRGSSTGKCNKNKEKIKLLLKETSEEILIETIDVYKNNCIESNTYMKNFATFLNNLPDLTELKKNSINLPELSDEQLQMVIDLEDSINE